MLTSNLLTPVGVIAACGLFLAATIAYAYTLDAFAQNGKVLPNCPRTFAEELQNEVNLGIARIAQGLNELVRPASVLLTHPNEAVTEGGKLRPASRAAGLAKLLKAPLHLAVSGRTMEFDGKGKCVAGC